MYTLHHFQGIWDQTQTQPQCLGKRPVSMPCCYLPGSWLGMSSTTTHVNSPMIHHLEETGDQGGKRSTGDRLDLNPGCGPLQMSLCSFLLCLLHLYWLFWLSQNLKYSCNFTGLDDEKALRFGITNAKICHTTEHCVPWTRNPKE